MSIHAVFASYFVYTCNEQNRFAKHLNAAFEFCGISSNIRRLKGPSLLLLHSWSGVWQESTLKFIVLVFFQIVHNATMNKTFGSLPYTATPLYVCTKGFGKRGRLFLPSRSLTGSQSISLRLGGLSSWDGHRLGSYLHAKHSGFRSFS